MEFEKRYGSKEELAGIRTKVRDGQLSSTDIAKIETLIVQVEEATRALRAAVVE